MGAERGVAGSITSADAHYMVTLHGNTYDRRCATQPEPRVDDNGHRNNENTLLI